MPLHEATGTLEEYSDLVLKLSGSPFTMGVAEEENHPPIGTSTSEPCHKMAADPESHNSPAKPESALIVSAKPESALARPAKPESPARMATTPADAPLWPGLIASVLDPPLVSVRAAGIPRPAPSPELAESAPAPAPSPELAESAPAPAPSPELVPQPVQPSSPSSPLVPPSSPSLLFLSSLALFERPRDPAPPECPRDPAPPECPLEVVEFPNNFLGGSFPPLLTETPDPSWLPEAPDLTWPPIKLPTLVLETICALSASCVSVSSRSQSLPGVPAPPWRAPAPVSSAPPWWAPVSSAPPWWAPVSFAPPWLKHWKMCLDL